VTAFDLRPPVKRTALLRVLAQLAVVAGLVILAALNISIMGWTEMEDGVHWVGNGSDVVATAVAPESPASRAGIQPGDQLLRID
jgi:membrane-associated protease RseP (regulator of RpoE activity)